MVTSPIAALLQPALERGAIEDPEVEQIRREWLDGGPLQVSDADALFHLQGILAGRNQRFNDVFEDILTTYILDRGEPKGSLSEEQGAWVRSMLDGGEGLVANAAELELLVRLVEQADRIPAALAGFALHQIRHAAITGEGPAAMGRIHFSRCIDARDVATIARLLQVSRGERRRAISREEAEILFDMAEACTGANDPAWDTLFAEAIQAHLLAASHPERGEHALDDRDSAWLRRRIQHDGQVSKAERALLALVGVRQMAAASSWDLPIGQML